jgi:hypothetical protein
LWSPDGTQPPEPGTDPMMPAIIADVLPPWDRPHAPVLDDRSSAGLLADSGGDPSGPREDVAAPSPARTPATGRERDHRPAAAAPIDRLEEPATGRRAGAPSPDRWPGPEGGRRERTGGPGREATAAPRPRTVAELVARTYAFGTAPGTGCSPPTVTPPAGGQRPRLLGRIETGERRSTRWSGDPFGEQRYASSPSPPFPTPEHTSLTGLTRRSMSRVGSIAFRLAFVAVFLLIVIQLVVSIAR